MQRLTNRVTAFGSAILLTAHSACAAGSGTVGRTDDQAGSLLIGVTLIVAVMLVRLKDSANR